MREKGKKFVICMDSFKGCLTSQEANEAVSRAIQEELPEAETICLPVSDGGEGFTEAYRSILGGDLRMVRTYDPLMREINATYILTGETAIIEVAKSIGLTLLSEKERNPLTASSYGVGIVVANAVRNGAKHIIVGLGGSASSDSGRGMIRALREVFAPNGRWGDIRAFDDIRFTIATDVDNPLCGEHGASRVFAPQKGATPEMVRLLEERARSFAAYSARHFGYDCQNEAGAGAAGGLGYAFMQYLKANRISGAAYLLDCAHFDTLLQDTDAVFTGEGAANRQTLMGKLPYIVMQHAKTRNVPTFLLAGQVSDREALQKAGFARTESINPRTMTMQEAMQKETAQRNLSQTVRNILAEWTEHA